MELNNFSSARTRELARLRMKEHRKRQKDRDREKLRRLDNDLLNELFSEGPIEKSKEHQACIADISSLRLCNSGVDSDEKASDAREASDRSVSEVAGNFDNEYRDGSDIKNLTENNNESEAEQDVESSSDRDSDIREASITEEDFSDFDTEIAAPEIDELREWAVKAPPLPHTRVEGLLKILRKRLLPTLPVCAKSFLDTANAEYDIQKLGDSEFVYFGATDSLIKTINPDLHETNVIDLIVNIDGMQLFRSSTRQFWPILCQVYSEKTLYEPFPIAIYSGMKKPTDIEEFLKKFIDELNELHENGLVIKNRMFQICIKAFVCDTPARALLKKIKGHGAYWGCERCTVKGEYQQHRVIYPGVDAPERTDTSFREQRNPEHHTGVSPLLKIKPTVDMISMFVLDFMHLLCLGVMKKLLNYWISRKQSRTKLSQHSQLLLSKYLVSLQSQIPIEFNRTTRSLTNFELFKAVEFKFILLYAGPVIFRKILSDNIYKHFLLLHTACRILCSKAVALKHWEYAKHYLIKFVQLAPKLYGETILIGNIHNLIHLADDVRYMKCPLYYISAFPFENALGKIKKLLRSGNKPLAQVCRRLHELFFANSSKPPSILSSIKILKSLCADSTGKIIIKRLLYKDSILTATSPNNTVLLNTGTLLEINEIYLPPNETLDNIHIRGIELIKMKSIFTYPCDSADLQMWCINKNKGRLLTRNLNCVSRKMVTLDLSDKKERIYTMPLLHM